MLDILLIVFVTGACACVMLLASQKGWLSSKTVCVMLGATFAYILSDAIMLAAPLFVVAALAITALLAWLGKVEHTEPNAATPMKNVIG